ncbi:MAG: hypothetical protein HC790_08685 [Acaryochloridaceae cyanobacterium CSU_3_4]|nr:hypothetical protein [Acaryochloridaceae cyanobacterium CSU_3_4]
MVRLLRQNSLLGLALVLSVWSIPGQAHTIKTTGTIAVTFHLEPDHHPRAGESAQVWFILTQKGGTVIPLDQCDCKLQIYSEADPSPTPLFQPPLTAVSAEQYQDIPGTKIMFPQPGNYRLAFQGRPRSGNLFTPFQFNFPVTVAQGADPSSLPDSATFPSPPSFPSQTVQFLALAILVGTGLGIGILRYWQRLKR